MLEIMWRNVVQAFTPHSAFTSKVVDVKCLTGSGLFVVTGWGIFGKICADVIALICGD